MSVSNLSFLDKDNFCYVCGKKLDNKKMELIIDDARRYAHRPEYQMPIKIDDPVIISEEKQFCSYDHYWAWEAKESEKLE